MDSRHLAVIVLNHTNEELAMLPPSMHLDHGKWANPSESEPPQDILAGESGIWRCQAQHVGGRIEGSVSYSIVGYEPKASVSFMWKTYALRPNEFTSACSEEDFTVQVIGGNGTPATAVFILSK